MRVKTAVLAGVLMAHAILAAEPCLAQTPAPALAQAEERADAGDLSGARDLLTRWFAESSSGASKEQVARGRFLRARLAPTAAAAESDYRWLVVEGGNALAPAARLRLAQLSLARGDLSGAASALDRLRSDHPDHLVVVHSWLWTGYVAEAGGDGEQACQAWRSASRLADGSPQNSGTGSGATGSSDGSPLPAPASLRPELDALLRLCGQPGAAPRFAIQFGAFRTRASAEHLVSAVVAAGVTARLVEADDGSGWYRVRTAGFGSRPPAERTARLLVAHGFEAVVVPVGPND